jgi:2',3'-cyclic-nucleotide 2'-phosphodiesterase (5'-nucleotidase family)
MNAFIKPYKDSLDAVMSQVIIVNDDMLTKKQPESDLGNVLADAMLNQANKVCGKKADVSILNIGGIRLTQLAPGPVTMGKIYELMPFENKMVLIEVKGSEMQKLFDAIAHAGGWPISGASFIIKSRRAVNTKIAGQPVDSSKTYILALSDYLAEGGDNLEMIKGKPYTDCKKTLRQAFIDEFAEMNAQGKHLKSYFDQRISD